MSFNGPHTTEKHKIEKLNSGKTLQTLRLKCDKSDELTKPLARCIMQAMNHASASNRCVICLVNDICHLG